MDAIPFVNPQAHGSKQQLTQVGTKAFQTLIYNRLYVQQNLCISQQFEALEYEVLEQSIQTELGCANQLLTNPVELN